MLQHSGDAIACSTRTARHLGRCADVLRIPTLELGACRLSKHWRSATRLLKTIDALLSPAIRSPSKISAKSIHTAKIDCGIYDWPVSVKTRSHHLRRAIAMPTYDMDGGRWYIGAELDDFMEGMMYRKGGVA